MLTTKNGRRRAAAPSTSCSRPSPPSRPGPALQARHGPGLRRACVCAARPRRRKAAAVMVLQALHGPSLCRARPPPRRARAPSPSPPSAQEPLPPAVASPWDPAPRPSSGPATLLLPAAPPPSHHPSPLARRQGSQHPFPAAFVPRTHPSHPPVSSLGDPPRRRYMVLWL